MLRGRNSILACMLWAALSLSCATARAAAPCEAATCFSIEGAAPGTLSKIISLVDQRTQRIIETWYSGKKCDFTKVGPDASTGLTCPDTLSGKSVGRICNLGAGEESTNRKGASCGTACSARMTCSKTFSYTDPDTSVTSSVTFNLNDSPSQGCKLCQLQISAGTQAEWDSYRLGTLGGDGNRLLAQGIGTLSGASCGCCTVNVNVASCEREASWTRGVLVQAALQKLNEVKADLAATPPVIRIPRGDASRCAAMRDKLRQLQIDFRALSVDASVSCTESATTDTTRQKKLQAAGLVQASCLRQASASYITMATSYLAVCRVLEEAEGIYIQGQSILPGVTRALDCSSSATMSECVEKADQELKTLIQGLTP